MDREMADAKIFDTQANASSLSTNRKFLTPISSGGDDISNADSGVSSGINLNSASDASKPAQDADQEPGGERSALQMAVIMTALCSALFLAALDSTIVTTALPTIISEFQAPSGYTWVGAAYTLGSSATVPIWGKISDIWGRKPILLVAVAIFWIGSLIAALSVNIGMLIAARAIQGSGGGGVLVLIYIAVSDLVSLRKCGQYYGIFGGVWALSSAIGPIVGGTFTAKVTWRWCFYINLPISGLAFILLFFVLKLHNPRTSTREGLKAIDWLGSALIMGATLQLLFGLEFGGVTYPWKSVTVIALIVFGVITFVVAMLVEQYVAKYPVIPLRLFSSPRNVIVYVLCFTHGLVFMATLYYLPLYFQAVLGASPLMSGVYLLAHAFASSSFSGLLGIWMKKTGQYYPPIIFGFVLMTLGCGLFIDLGAEVNWAKLFIFQIIAGIGIGPNFQATLIALHAGLHPGDIGVGTSTFQFIRQLATSTSIVIGGVVFQNGMQRQFPTLLAELGPEIANQLTGSNAGANVGLVASLKGEAGKVARGAYWNSLRDMFIVYTVISGLGLLLTPFVRQQKLSKEFTEHKTGLQSLARRDRNAKPEVQIVAGEM
ncbi:MFS general substrate transporter [Xylaria nigripes]|nr:MFS general substrate transporter [Xylaria nigripes]